MAVYVVKQINSDLAGGADFSYEMSANAGTTLTLTPSIAGSVTETSYAFTQPGFPSNAAWGLQTFTVNVNITTANTNLTLAMALSRINYAGVVQETTPATAGQILSATGVKSFTIAAYTFAAGSVTDRMRLEFRFQNTAASAQTCVVQFGTTNTALTTSLTEFSGTTIGTVAPSEQITSDYSTIIPVGGNTATDGASTPVVLESFANIRPTQTTVTPKLEVQPVGTNFTGTANFTGKTYMPHEPVLPVARRGAMMTYDSLNRRYLMTQGYDGTTRFSDVLECDAVEAARWRQVLPGTATNAPVGKNLGTAVQLNANGKSWMVVWGGSSTAGDNGAMNILDCTTRGSEAWTLVTQTSAPAARSYTTQHMVAVPNGTTAFDVYLFGGWGSARFNDLSKVTISMASTVPTALTWTTVTANGATGSPSIRSGTNMFYDAANNRLVLVGGYNGTTYLMDVWQYSFTTPGWTQLAPTGTAPAGRELHNGAFDPVSKRYVGFAGWTTAAATGGRNDIFQLDFSGSTAGVFSTLRTHDYPNCDIPPFSSGAATYDSDRRLIVEFGQNAYDGTDKYTYCFDFRETVSTTMTLYGLNQSSDFYARDAPAYVYDSAAGKMLLINGFSYMDDNATIARGDHMNDVWGFDPATNNIYNMNQGVKGVVYKEGVLAVYDSVADRIILFGGLTATSQVSNELWELKRNADGMYTARHMNPTGTKPGARWLMAGAFDSVNNRIVLWGGTNATALIANTDMWQLSLASGDGAWTSLTATGTAPPAVWQPGYSYDTTTKRLYIASGATNFAASTFSTRVDILRLDIATPAWINLTTTGITTGVRGGALASDQNNTYLWFFGGYNGTVVNNNLYLINISGATATLVTATGTAPGARRSSACWYVGGKYYISCGRPVTGTWFNDLWSLTPNYTTPTSSVWAQVPLNVYARQAQLVSGLTTGNSYHWQAWTSGQVDTAAASYGANTETSTDFSIGTVAVGGAVSLGILGVG